MLSSEEYVSRTGSHCPACESDNIVGRSVEIDAGIAWQEMYCNACSASWNDVYKLIAYDNLKTADNTGATDDHTR